MSVQDLALKGTREPCFFRELSDDCISVGLAQTPTAFVAKVIRNIAPIRNKAMLD